MEARNFHTALLGGFRKKDVVAYLAEEKRLQEGQLDELRRAVGELEGQLAEAVARQESDLAYSSGLQSRLAELQEQLDTEREARGLAEHQLTLTNAEKGELERRLAQTEAELADAGKRDLSVRLTLENKIDELQARLMQAEARPQAADDSGELRQLRQALQQEQARAALLEGQLAAQAADRSEGENTDQLWALCGKMERTIRQMEQMLDGPYRMTCYPEPPVREAEPEKPPVQETPKAQPPRQPAYRDDPKPSVSSLLQRIRGK